MIFYKKITSKHSFKGCNYSDTNKYIYLTLVNENNTINERNIVRDTISNQNYLSELEIEKRKLFYQFKTNEQII